MISIIIPVYNVSKYLDKCLQSVVTQTYSNIQIILVNDGSTDNSCEICEKWCKKDKRIEVIHKRNGGLSNARNVGIERAQGEYLMFVDSDDIISDDLCELLHNHLLENNADLAICDTYHIFDNNNFTFQRDNKVEIVRCFDKVEAICNLWYQKSFLPSAWGKLYKKELFKQIRFTEGIIFEDIDIMHEIFYLCNKIIYTNIKAYGYVHHENSITTKKYTQKDNVILDICEKIMKFAANKNIQIQCAAKSYYVTGALRVYLNAPETAEYQEVIYKAKNILNSYGKKVLKDKNIRKKNRYALYLYFYLRPLLKPIYQKIDRWK